MAVNKSRKNNAYGFNSPLINVFPAPIASVRAPTTRDKAPVGTVWCDTVLDDVYILASIRDNAATWINSGGGGGVFANLTIDGFLTVGGVVTLNNLDADSVVFTNGASELTASSGLDGALIIGATGAAPDWGLLDSSDGSVVITNGANSIDLIVSGAAASTFPTDAGTAIPFLGATTITGGTNIATSGAGDVVTIDVDDAPTFAGLITGQDGITVTGGAASFTSDTNAGQDIYLHADGGANETIELFAEQGSTAASIFVHSDAGGVALESTGLANDNAITLTSTVGGVATVGALQVSLTSSENAVDAIFLQTTHAAGGIDINSGTGGITIDSTGAYSIDAAAASNVSVAGAGVDLTLSSAAGQLIMQAEEAANNALRMVSGVGGLDVDVALQMNLTSSQAAATAVRVYASNAAGGIDVDAGTNGITIDTTGALSLDSATASNFTVTGAADLTLASTAGRVIVNGEQAAANAVTILSAAGGLDVDVALQMNLNSNQAAATAVSINASGAGGGIGFTSNTGGFNVGTTGAMLMAGQVASEIGTTTNAVDMSVTATLGSVNVIGGEAATDAVLISANHATGGITLDAGVVPGIRITNGTQTAQILIGTGSPDTAVAGLQGSLFINVGGGASTILYVNTDGATAWSPLTA